MLDGDALDDLRKVARGVVGGQEGRGVAASLVDALHLSPERHMRKGVNLDFGVLTGFDTLELHLSLKLADTQT